MQRGEERRGLKRQEKREESIPFQEKALVQKVKFWIP
jgi:hypothetical protein